jgi:Heterokaryon incompatibility protein (HET)
MTHVNFHYPTIENRSVRLLNVRGSSSGQSRLECNFLHGSLDDEHLRYEAISYCWADQTPTQLIRCEGEEALVTKNCEAALFRFRPCLENETRLLWIDSLCINQNDIQERNCQVGLMGEIYAKADQVLIWLGNESGGPLPHEPQYYIDAFDWMVRLADAAEYQDLGRRTQRLLQLMQELKSSSKMHALHFDNMRLRGSGESLA